MAWLDRNPPARRQFRRPRRDTPSGVIVIHTAENTATGGTGPDPGAENVAQYIRARNTPGSYHWVVDSDSRIQLVEHDAEAYGEGTGGNRYAMHLSFACSAAQWPLLSPEWRAQALTQAGLAVADIVNWLRAGGHPVPALDRISEPEYRAKRAGFIAHADIDPARRTDPGPLFPWEDFFSQVGRQLAPRPVADDAPTRIVAAYLRGGRPPDPAEVHAWLVDCAKKRLRGQNLDATFRYIEHAVRSER